MPKRGGRVKKRDQVPERFRSWEEVGAFWDVHNSEDYPEIWAPVEHFEVIPRNQRTSHVVEPLSEKKAKDVMTTRVIEVTPSIPIQAVAQLLVRYKKIGMVPVVDEKDKAKVVGIIAETDLLTTPGARTVMEVMKRPTIFVRLETPLDEVARVLAKWKIRQVPVVEKGKLVGVVSSLDILRVRQALS